MGRLISALSLFLKLAASYLIAAAVLLTYAMWPNFGGHPHIPCTSFPCILILSPWMPVEMIFAIQRMGFDPKIVKALIVFAVTFAASIATLHIFVRRARRSEP